MTSSQAIALLSFFPIFEIATSGPRGNQCHLEYYSDGVPAVCRLCYYDDFNDDVSDVCKSRNNHMHLDTAYPVARDGVMTVAWCRNGYLPSCPVPSRRNSRMIYKWNANTFGGNTSFNVCTRLTLICRPGFEVVGHSTVECTHSTVEGAESATKLSSDLGYCVRKTPPTTKMTTSMKIMTTPKIAAVKDDDGTPIMKLNREMTAIAPIDISEGGLSPLFIVLAAFGVVALIVIGVVAFRASQGRCNSFSWRLWNLSDPKPKAQAEPESGISSLASSVSSAESQPLRADVGDEGFIGDGPLPSISQQTLPKQSWYSWFSTKMRSLHSQSPATIDT